MLVEILVIMLASVVERRDVFAYGALDLYVVGADYLIYLLASEEEDKARAASQLAELQAVKYGFGDEFFRGTVELHAKEILVEFHKQAAIVLLHCVTAATPGQMQINACRYCKRMVSQLAIGNLQMSF